MINNIEAHISIQIPDDLVLIKKVEYEELVKESELGKWENMKWLKEHTGIKSINTLKEKLLYPFKEELEPFVVYPDGSGGEWRFNKHYMKRWLDENFKRVWS